MFYTGGEVNIRDKAGMTGTNIIGKTTANQAVEIQGVAVVKDNYIWHKIKDKPGWIAERNIDGSHILLGWRANTPPPAIPPTMADSFTGMPEQPAQFSHQQLIDAVHQAATQLGTVSTIWTDLDRGRIGWIQGDRGAAYKGMKIADLPFYNRAMKEAIIKNLHTITKGAAQPIIAAPAQTQKPATTQPAATQPAAAQPTKPTVQPVAPAAAAQPAAQAQVAAVQYTNQQVINAFYSAATAIGKPHEAWDYVEAAQLASIASDRKAVYSGKPMAQLPGLSPEFIKQLEACLKNEVVSDKQPAATVVIQAPAAPSSTGLSPFTTSGSQFLLNGKPFRFVGVNARELAYYGHQHYGITKWTRAEHIDQQIEMAAQMKAQVVRFFAACNIDEAGQPRTDTQMAIRRTKAVLDKLAARKMYGLITLTDAKWSGLDVRVPAQFRGPAGQPFLGDAKEVLNNEFYRGGYKQGYIQFVQELVGALAGHPAIFAWAIGNEMQTYPSTDPSIADCDMFINFFKDASETIRRLSPKNLITTGIESCWHLFVLNAYERAKYCNKLYAIPTIDFATLHTYQEHGNYSNLGHNNDQIRRETELARTVWKKPIIMEEIGAVGGQSRGNGATWIAPTCQQLFDMGVSGVLQWGFSAFDSDLGVGDGDSGMHRTPGGHPLYGGDWQQLFDTYKGFGSQFWTV